MAERYINDDDACADSIKNNINNNSGISNVEHGLATPTTTTNDGNERICLDRKVSKSAKQGGDGHGGMRKSRFTRSFTSLVSGVRHGLGIGVRSNSTNFNEVNNTIGNIKSTSIINQQALSDKKLLSKSKSSTSATMATMTMTQTKEAISIRDQQYINKKQKKTNTISGSSSYFLSCLRSDSAEKGKLHCKQQQSQHHHRASSKEIARLTRIFGINSETGTSNDSNFNYCDDNNKNSNKNERFSRKIKKVKLRTNLTHKKQRKLYMMFVFHPQNEIL